MHRRLVHLGWRWSLRLAGSLAHRREGPRRNLDILKPREEEGGDGDGPDGGEPVDEMYDKAVAVVAETQSVSISMIQRRLRIGYNRAARIVEHMEREGVVSPPDGTNKREVLITPAA